MAESPTEALSIKQYDEYISSLTDSIHYVWQQQTHVILKPGEAHDGGFIADIRGDEDGPSLLPCGTIQKPLKEDALRELFAVVRKEVDRKEVIRKEAIRKEIIRKEVIRKEIKRYQDLLRDKNGNDYAYQISPSSDQSTWSVNIPDVSIWNTKNVLLYGRNEELETETRALEFVLDLIQAEESLDRTSAASHEQVQ